MTNTDVLIIGAGPSGLSCATYLRQKTNLDVTIIEREPQAGGIPRHCGHYPFGIREAKRLLKGPEYARMLVTRALNSGVKIKLNTTAISRDGLTVLVSNPDGLETIEAERIVLATGAREGTRAQRNIGGIKTKGILNTGALQGLVYLNQLKPFSRPVILGSELVSYSAIQTCRHLNISPVAMVDLSPSPKAQKILSLYPTLYRIPSFYNSRQFEIIGEKHVEAVRFVDRKQRLQQIDCDGVIISGAFRPEASLARAFELEIDDATKGPSVDQYARTSCQSIFAIGNGLRAIETSGRCWQEGHDLGRSLSSIQADTTEKKAIHIASNLIGYVMPKYLAKQDTTPVFQQLQLRLSQSVRGTIHFNIDGKSVAQKRIHSAPDRSISFKLDAHIIQKCFQQSYELSISLER